MDRRSFLQLATFAMAAKAAERVFPFRVYSIPKEIIIPVHSEESLGLGCLDTVAAATETSISMVNSNIFFPGQQVEIFSADASLFRGKAIVTGVVDGQVIIGSPVHGLVPGDLILI